MLRYSFEDVRCEQEVSLAASDASTTFKVGSVRLLRRKDYKGQYFTPYIPTSHVLFLFPSAIDLAGRRRLAPGMGEKMTSYLTSIRDGSGVAFTVFDAAVCTDSGTAAVVVCSDSVSDSLTLLDHCAEAIHQQTSDMCTTSMYVQSFPCTPLPDDCPSAASLLDSYYLIPTCVLCADRLEINLRECFTDESICCCEESCTCLYTSACTVCQMFAQQQQQQKSIGGATAASGRAKRGVASKGQCSTGDWSSDQKPPQQQQPVVRCQDCREVGDPWVCLLCGYVGCSRYQARHARDHCIAHRHFFSINLLTQQIWDYDSDDFVHCMVISTDASGGTTRVQFPGRVDPVVEPPEIDDIAELKMAKMSVNAKYDAKLSTSYAQFATMLKNELDASRAALEESVGYRPQRSGSATSTLAMATLANYGEGHNIYAAMEGNALSPGPASSIIATHAAQMRKASSLTTLVRSMVDALATLEVEGNLLEADEAEVRGQLRAAVQENVKSDLNLVTEINDIENTLREIELNRRLQAQLQREMSPGDSAAITVMMGDGRAEGSSRKAKARGKRGGR